MLPEIESVVAAARARMAAGERPTAAEARQAIATILLHLEGESALEHGELREGLARTPERVVDSWLEIHAGYDEDPAAVLDATFNAEQYDGIVLLRDITFHSTCEHHLLPFSGVAHVAYIPVKRIVGISKLARIVEVFGRRLQNQERITRQVADALMEHVDPLGAAVIIEAQHQCMSCRGAKQPNALMTTSAMRGAFFDTAAARSELMQLIHAPRPV